MKGRFTFAVLGALSAATGCVYYNAMWSAERFAKQARRAEARGEDNEARGLWLRAAVKAESVHTRHPTSKWADDALVLRAEALVRGGACPAAGDVLPRAQAAADDGEQRERLALVIAWCALEDSQPAAVAPLLEPVLQSRDAGRQSQAHYLAGRAAAARGDLPGAVAHLRESRERAAGPALIRVWLEMGRADEAMAELRRLAPARMPESQWSALLDATARALGAESASTALDRVLAEGRVSAPGRSRLQLADGDRLLAAGHYAAARDRYDAVTAAEQGATAQAVVRSHRARAALAPDLAALTAIRDSFEHAARRLGAAADAPEARALDEVFGAVIDAGDGEAAAFRAAELARDSLHADRVAAEMFLNFARRHPESLFAPKALVAALGTRPDARDSVLAVLADRYAESPYTQALHGAASPTYAAAEDSLARALGLATVRDRGAVVVLVAAPRTGPRGPLPDDGFVAERTAVAPRDSVAADTVERVVPGRRPRPTTTPGAPNAPRPAARP